MEFRAKLRATNSDRLVFIDECGLSIKLTRAYARSQRGKRVFGFVPGRWGENLSLIGAMRYDGPTALMTVPGATDGEVFRAYVSEVLAPTLRGGDIVVMDNLSVHKVAGIREAVEAHGASLLYQPPYSPDFNPIEKMWSKVKALLNAVKARTVEALEQAVSQALRLITPADSQGWFGACGYCDNLKGWAP